MDYYISRNQETYGPYSEGEIKEHLESGAISVADHAWREGESDWVQLGELLALTEKATTEEAERRSSAENLLNSAESPNSAPENPSPEVGRQHGPGFRGGRILAIALGIGVLVYMASPYVCLFLLNRALGSGDLPMIERLVDFPAVRQGLRAEALTNQQHQESAAGPEPYLGVAPDEIPAAVDYIEQRYLTPSGLASLLSRPELVIRERSAGTFASMTAQTIDPTRWHWAFFSGPTEFKADLDGLKLKFRLSGGFWRLERISFP